VPRIARQTCDACRPITRARALFCCVLCRASPARALTMAPPPGQRLFWLLSLPHTFLDFWWEKRRKRKQNLSSKRSHRGARARDGSPRREARRRVGLRAVGGAAAGRCPRSSGREGGVRERHQRTDAAQQKGACDEARGEKSDRAEPGAPRRPRSLTPLGISHVPATLPRAPCTRSHPLVSPPLSFTLPSPHVTTHRLCNLKVEDGI
jgi:hypothetical protein